MFEEFVARIETKDCQSALCSEDSCGVRKPWADKRKGWIGRILDHLKALVIQTDKWTIAAKDEGV